MTGYRDRGIDGRAYRNAGGLAFGDSAGANWWIIFQALNRGRLVSLARAPNVNAELAIFSVREVVIVD